MPRTVAIVLDTDYADRLEKLAFHTPVWIVDTPPNRSAAQHAWHAAVEWPHITVTLFRAFTEPASPADWRALIEQIDLHEKTFDIVDVIGSRITTNARTALEQHGFEKFDETDAGFRAGRARKNDVMAS